MTLKAAASAILEDLVSSGSFLRTEVSACGDYSVLDNCAGCAVVLLPSMSNFQTIAYGGVRENTWGLVAEGYVRDTGYAETTVAAVVDMHDALTGAINEGTNANTSTRWTGVMSTNYGSHSYITPGGNEFLLVTANIQSGEDP